jgi:hypothetical protein
MTRSHLHVIEDRIWSTSRALRIRVSESFVSIILRASMRQLSVVKTLSGQFQLPKTHRVATLSMIRFLF